MDHSQRFEFARFRAAKKTARTILRSMDDFDLPHGPRPIDQGAGADAPEH